MSRGEPLDERYFAWLYRMIGTVTNPNPGRSHWRLAKRLYTTKFLYFIPNDDNRAMDGKELREEFLEQSLEQSSTYTLDLNWLDMECSMLEMLIALARRAEFHANGGRFDGDVGDWFWKLMDNVKLSRYSDNLCNERSLEDIDLILDRVNDRSYSPTGRGGLFPLRRPREDQRRVELWYQMSAYLLENRYIRP